MKLLKNRHPKRFLKFSIIGVVNFFVDLVILNLLSYVTGFNKGFYASVFSALSFFIANINSYFLNRRWTFKSNNKDSGYKAFLAISLFGVLVNIFVVFILTTFGMEKAYFRGIDPNFTVNLGIMDPYIKDIKLVSNKFITKKELPKFLNLIAHLNINH